MSKVSPFAIQKALIVIGGEPKSVKRLRSGDLLIETNSALQTKSFLLAKSFLNSPVTISPHKTLNFFRGVISETDLLSIPEEEILEGFFQSGCYSVSTSPSSTQVQLEPSTSSTVAPVSEPQPPIPVSCDVLSTTENVFTPIEASLAISTSSSNSSIQPPSTSTIKQSLKKIKNPRDRKRKEELLKTIIDIKMAQHKPRKPAPVEYTTDEEDMIVYDAEEEIESNPDCDKNGKTYYKGSLLPSPTRHRK
ncbi:uncharacterized protein TNCV_4817131 [Trichonephila clavipes]|nr:uncharacterized protein TNCV_4817131 [Trichonephila clavipes]